MQKLPEAPDGKRWARAQRKGIAPKKERIPSSFTSDQRSENI